MALYLGDTEVAPVIEVPVPEKRFNVGINNLLGTVDENGMYVVPTEPFTPDFSNVKDLSSRALFYKFSSNVGVTGDIVFGFENISGAQAMNYAFNNCSNITSVSFPALTTISGAQAMNYAFSNCSNITSVSFPQLATVSDNYIMGNAFYNCPHLTSISFPALKEILPETTQNQFNSMFSGCTALTEIHFPAAMQARVEQLDSYSSKWGATNATIYFDL